MGTTYLTVPGMGGSSEDHWQSRWEREFPDQFRRIEQAEWNTPDRSDWTAKIEGEVRAADPNNTVLIAHSMGCTGVVHWALEYSTIIKGALLVAPSDCETEKYRATFQTSGFTPIPLRPLPFKAIVVASTNDEWVPFERAKLFAQAWNADLVNVGEKGHINVASGYGEWIEGLELLKRLD